MVWRILFMYAMAFVFSTTKLHGFWMWTPGDAVDDNIQSSLVSGYQPDQPIPFNHKRHAGDRQIPCEYCHADARRSIVAGIPGLNTCMGCHKFVNTNADPIKFLTAKYKANEPIEWIKVHDLPDFVRFSHRMHVNAKGKNGEKLLQCQTCHGPVETMEVVGQWAPLQMGWCVDCHIKTEVPQPGMDVMRHVPISCNTCHF